MNEFDYPPEKKVKVKEENQEGNITRTAVNLLANWSKKLDEKAAKLDEKALINADFELMSLIKQQVLVMNNDPKRNELDSHFFLEIISKGVDQMKFDGRATKNTREYLEKAKEEHNLRGLK